jgi:hypothetical protein
MHHPIPDMARNEDSDADDNMIRNIFENDEDIFSNEFSLCGMDDIDDAIENAVAPNEVPEDTYNDYIEKQTHVFKFDVTSIKESVDDANMSVVPQKRLRSIKGEDKVLYQAQLLEHRLERNKKSAANWRSDQKTKKKVKKQAFDELQVRCNMVEQENIRMTNLLKSIGLA